MDKYDETRNLLNELNEFLIMRDREPIPSLDLPEVTEFFLHKMGEVFAELNKIKEELNK